MAPVRHKICVLYVEKIHAYLDQKCASSFREHRFCFHSTVRYIFWTNFTQYGIYLSFASLKKNYYNFTERYIGSPINALATVFHTVATYRFCGLASQNILLGNGQFLKISTLHPPFMIGTKGSHVGGRGEMLSTITENENE